MESNIKIGDKMYGTNLTVFYFKTKIEEENENMVVLVSGGVFNSEVENQLKNIKTI
jgi:hypothetical protein